MSEKEPTNWEKLKGIVREEVKGVMTELYKDSKETSQKTSQSSNEHKPHTLEDLLDCPDCYPNIKKKVLEKEILSRKDKEYECINCKTGVDEDEETCPTCGETEARERD